MAHSPMPFRGPRRQRGVPYHHLTPSEMMMEVPGLRKRMLTFTSNDTLCAAIRVSWTWFDDAVAVLYNTMEVRVALGMGSKLSPRFMEYNSVVRQVTQVITTKGAFERGELPRPLTQRPDAAPATPTTEFPFLPTDTVTIGAAAEAAPLLFPSVHSVVSDLPPGYTWGWKDLKKGGDRSFLSFTEESGYMADTLYVERCIGLSPDDSKLDSEVFQTPVIPDFDVQLVYTVVAVATYDGRPILPFESMMPISRIRDPVKAFRTQGIDVHIRSIMKVFSYPMPSEWPFDPAPTIDCDRIIGLGIKEFRALAQTPGVVNARTIRLNTASIPSTGSFLRPTDIYPIRDTLLSHLPHLKDLSLSLIIDEQSETDYTDCLLPDLPPGPLKSLTVKLWSKSRASTSKATSKILSFPFNLIRRLAACVVEGGSLILHGQDLPGQTAESGGMDLSAVITWIRARPASVRRKIAVMDYAALGVACTNDLSRLCFDYGAPMTLSHSLAYFFTSDLLGQIDRHLRDPAQAPRPPSKAPPNTLSLLASRAAAFELNNLVMEAHWKGMRSDKDTLAARAAKILWDCKNAGMAEAPGLMTNKYPTLFDGLRKAAQTAAGQAKLMSGTGNGNGVVNGNGAR